MAELLVVLHGKKPLWYDMIDYSNSDRFKEFIEQAGDEQMQSMVLEGGVKGWVKSGPQFTRLMDGYKESYWQDLFAQEEAKKAAAQGQDDKNLVGQGDVTK